MPTKRLDPQKLVKMGLQQCETIIVQHLSLCHDKGLIFGHILFGNDPRVEERQYFRHFILLDFANPAHDL